MFHRRNLSLLILMLSICILSGCARKDKDVIAWVNGEKITTSDFNDKLSQLPLYFQQNEAQRRKFLDSLVDREILLAEAKKRNMAQDKEVKKRLEEVLEQILVEELVKNAIPETTVNEDNLKKFYEERKTQFIEPAKAQVSQILVRSEKEANELLKQLKEGKDFAGLARTKSISPDARNGGDIGYFGRGEMLPEFEEVAFNLKKGETSKVVKSPFGYHILKVTDKKEKRQKTFPEAKEEIEVILRQKQQREALEKWFKGLKDKAKIKINKEFLAQNPVEVQKEEGSKEKR